MVYLVKDDDKVRAFCTEAEMKAAGFKKASLTVSDEEYNSNGCYARILDGEIIVGKTDEEKAEEEKQEKIAGYKMQLAELDRQAGAGRFVREMAMDYARTKGKNNGKGWLSLVEIENRAAEIREELAPLLPQEPKEEVF